MNKKNVVNRAQNISFMEYARGQVGINIMIW